MSALEDIIKMYTDVATGTTLKQIGKLAEAELALKNKMIELAIITLREVVHDRPTAHSDKVWEHINSTLSKLESLDRGEKHGL